MSTDIYLGCEKCKSAIHIAQEGLSGFTFYRGEHRCLDALGQWLEQHMQCDPLPRIMLEQDVYPDDGWEHLEWSEQPR